jgi:hypothetical protein
LASSKKIYDRVIDKKEPDIATEVKNWREKMINIIILQLLCKKIVYQWKYLGGRSAKQMKPSNIATKTVFFMLKIWNLNAKWGT